MVSDIPFDVQVIQDDDTEPQETFFINVSPVRNAIVLTKRVAVTVCGGILMLFTISKILFVVFSQM